MDSGSCGASRQTPIATICSGSIPKSRRNRFNATIADDTVRGYAATARGSDVILHGFFVDGVLRGVADLRILRREAEAAFSIEKPWQSHGVGSAVLERSLLAARNRGAKRLQVCCLVDNHRMQQLARKFEAELIFDCGTVIGTMENPNPTPLSLMQEMAADGHSFAAAYVDFQSRLLRPVAALAVPLSYPSALQVQLTAHSPTPQLAVVLTSRAGNTARLRLTTVAPRLGSRGSGSQGEGSPL